MKFNFENHIPKEEVEPELEAELTQEKFDEQILEEANKLGVSLQELQEDINKYGGPEKFKEKFEQKTNQYSNMVTLAGNTIEHQEQVIKDKNQSTKALLIVGGVFAALDAVMIGGLNHGGNISLENLEDTIGTLKQTWESGWMGQSMVGMVTLFAGMSVVSFIGSIKQGIEARKEKRKKKINELKFKMTGTEIK